MVLINFLISIFVSLGSENCGNLALPENTIVIWSAPFESGGGYCTEVCECQISNTFESLSPRFGHKLRQQKSCVVYMNVGLKSQPNNTAIAMRKNMPKVSASISTSGQ